MRNLSTLAVRAVAATLGAAALVLTLASATHVAPTATHHDAKLAGITSKMVCPFGRCG